MCYKQTSVSHSSTESEILFLDAGLRLDDITALDLWDLIFAVLGNTTQNHDRTEKLVVCRDASHERYQETQRRNSEREQIGTLLERQREQILACCQAEIRKHVFQADYERRSIQKLNVVIESHRGEIYRAHQGDEQLRRDQQLLHEQLLKQNRDLREAHEKRLYIRYNFKEKIDRRSRHYP